LRLICESRHAQGETLRRRPAIEEQYNPQSPPMGAPADCGSNIFTMTKSAPRSPGAKLIFQRGMVQPLGLITGSPSTPLPRSGRRPKGAREWWR